MAALDPDLIADALRQSCLDELDAPKPGNVHRFAPGHGMEVGHFIASAQAIAPWLIRRDLCLGERIFRSVEASWAAAGCNTNLGIILLCAPLIETAFLVIETAFLARTRSSFRRTLTSMLQALTLTDTDWIFRAIALASPGGLGQSDQYDVRNPATIHILTAMKMAAPHDSIAGQYANGFADVLGFGLRRARWAHHRWPHPDWATALSVYLGFLGRMPDSHIYRKYGDAPLASVMGIGKTLDRAMKRAVCLESLLPQLLAQDARFKTEKINPGTSADLTVASLLALRLMDMMPTGRRT